MSLEHPLEPTQHQFTRREKWAVRLGIPSLAVTAACAVLIWPFVWLGYSGPIQWMSTLWWGVVLPVGIASYILASGDLPGLVRQAIKDFRVYHKL